MQRQLVPESPGGGCCRRGSEAPILIFARTIPIVRTRRPPGAFSWAPNTCSMRARTVLFLEFASVSASLSGRLRSLYTAPEAPCLELLLRLCRAVGAVGVDVPRCIAPGQKLVELLAVVLAGIANPVVSDQLVPGIGVHMVLVAEVAAPMLLRPARILVLLPVLRWTLLPVLRVCECLACLAR